MPITNAYYNDNEPYAAAWTRNLIEVDAIPAGIVDTRSIHDVTADDLRGHSQVHLFSGIGGWPYALRLAGWPDDLPVWTASCPCQPFSNAGKKKGTDDDRHLWPVVERLIAECRPAVVFGEQVAGKLGRAWLSTVRLDLEALGYAVGVASLTAASVGAPHIRERLYWVAYAQRAELTGSQYKEGRPFRHSGADGVAYADSRRWSQPSEPYGKVTAETEPSGSPIERWAAAESGGLGNTEDERHSGRSETSERGRSQPRDRAEQSSAADELAAAASGLGNSDDSRLHRERGRPGDSASETQGTAGKTERTLESERRADGRRGTRPADDGQDGIGLADADDGGHGQHRRRPGRALESTRGSEREDEVTRQADGREGLGSWHNGEDSRRLGNADSKHDSQRREPAGQRLPEPAGLRLDIWGIGNAQPVFCRDGKTRFIEPSIQPLANGLPAAVDGRGAVSRGGTLRGAGNAIVPQVAAAFITSFMEAI